MQIILLERVENLGSIGDVVTVRPGFARNFLLPQHKALRATEGNLKRFAVQRAEIEARNASTRAQAEEEGKALNGASYVLIRQAGESGQLYGSVSARDIVDAMAAEQHMVDRQSVALDKPIKTLGVHTVKVRLHPEVVITVSVNVARSADEAERQSKGENVIAAAQAEERADANARAAELAAVAAEAASERGGEE
ncbi:MAG: 50S ribosomal protein L9 [Caulobacterales bacterium]|jgi:large subunit ribosomal protein L9